MSAPMSRRERRKEAKQSKNQKKHQSWLEHQKSQIFKRAEQAKRIYGDSKPNVNKSSNSFIQNLSERDGKPQDTNSGRHQDLEGKNVGVKTKEAKSRSSQNNGSSASKTVKQRKGLKRNAKTKFLEFLEMDMKKGDLLAQEDLEIERRLSKKLRVKDGKLRGTDDELNLLLDGIFDCGPDADEFPVERLENISHKKNRKRNKSKQKQEEVLAADTTNGGIISGGFDIEENPGAELKEEEGTTKTTSRKRRRKKSKQKQEGDTVGDTNNSASKQAEAHEAEVEVALQETPTNTPSVASSMKYVAPHLRSHVGKESEEQAQIRRRIRGLLNRLSESNVESVTGEMTTIFRDEYQKEDNLSLRNLTLLLSFLCTFGVCSSDLIYDFLILLSKRLTETDVSTILTVLQCCGMKIRGDDPSAMKNFIQSVQSRVNDLKISFGEDQEKLIGKRMEFMLETICDIKNNKRRPKEDTAQHTRIKKWLQKLRVEDILIRGLTWSKLLDPNKKGQWWLCGDRAATTDDIEEVANTIDKEVLEAQKMLQLAASQRMNTDARKAIFCIIMSGEDYIDAFEKLLRLDLPGKQDREIMRVLVECCLQEKVFNKYYTALASKFCEHDKNHKYTLQYCLWDHFKELESMHLLRSMHLAKFVAEMVASFNISLSILKSVDLSDARQQTPKRIMHFRILFESLFEYPDKLVWNTFTRLAINPELETLRRGIEFFIREYVVKSNKAIANKFKLAKKALNNTGGVLM
ncbi:sgd1p, putative [Ricinus communis]|uniref:Sgd1p, putative n=1 Tax=Ricinus communis TaxID=3988 RepID=B9SI94_RICCO|nr:sgd1p, putative [Ricinus communis]